MRLRHAVPLSLVLLLVAAVPAMARVSLVEVPLSADRHELTALARGGFDVTEDVTPERAVVLTPDDPTLQRLGALVPYRFQIADYGAFLSRSRAADGQRATRLQASGLPSGRRSYRVLQDYYDELTVLADRHPGLVRPVMLPEKSYEGRDLRGVELASGVNRADDGRPTYVVMGLHHAREWPSAEVAMEWALDLAAGYGVDARTTALLDGVRIIVVPVVNPDGLVVSRGTAEAGGTGAAALQRKNCKPSGPADAALPCSQRLSTDLNRNYGAYWGGNGASTDAHEETYRGPGPWSEPESRAVHELTQRLQVTGFQLIHNVAGQVLRPPGFSALGRAPDEPALKRLGDAMADATGYQSQYGYELYEVTGATEDWNYSAQNAFGYTIELGGTGFQGPYQENVIDQYLGVAGTATAGKGVREALLLAAEQAGDPAGHSVISGSAPAGATLRLHKDFTTRTSDLCVTSRSATADCGPRTPAIGIPDFLDSRLTVPESGRYVWHIDPSTRPFARATPESWTLTCERDGAPVVSQRLFIAIGQAKSVDPCGTPPSAGGTSPAGPPATAGRVRSRVTVAVDRTSRGRALAKGIRVRVRCTVRCTVTGRGTLSGKAAATGHATLRSAGRRTFTLRFSKAGRSLLARHRRATLRLVVRGTVGGRIHTTTHVLTL